MDWSSILPSIIGEAEGEKFSVEVILGKASSFLSYNPLLRKFISIPKPKGPVKEGNYSVKIELTNKGGATSRVELMISYVCPQPEVVIEPLNSYQPRYDLNAPLPYIYSISQYGEVKIKFNTTMDPKASLNETEIYSP